MRKVSKSNLHFVLILAVSAAMVLIPVLAASAATPIIPESENEGEPIPGCEDEGEPIPGCGDKDRDKDKDKDEDKDKDLDPPNCTLCIGEQEDYFQANWNTSYDGTKRFDLNAYRSLDDFGDKDGFIHGKFNDGGDVHFSLLFPGMKGTINWGQGKDKPIDVKQYSRAVYRLCANNATDNLKSHFYWYKASTFDGIAGFSNRNSLYSGCHIYVHDWSKEDAWANAEAGKIYGIRFDFDHYEVGGTFDLDWFRIAPPPNGKQKLTINWEDVPNGNTELKLYIDSDNSGADGDLVATLPSAGANGSFQWGSLENKGSTVLYPSDLLHGTYYLYIEGNGGYLKYLEEPLQVNQVPMVSITSPSMTSGTDYSETAGNKWDMSNDYADAEFNNVFDYQYSNNVLTAKSSDNDPGIKFSVPTPIDSSYYRYFSIDVWSQYSFFNNPGISGGVGGMMRVLWGADGTRSTTEDIVIHSPKQWHTYTIDLATCYLEGGGGGGWKPVLSNWSDEQWLRFRFDPNENTKDMEWQWKVKNVSLTGPQIADGSIELKWNTRNESLENTTVQLFYDKDAAGFDGTLITTLLSTKNSNLYKWDTSDIPTGEYYLYICTEDPFQKRCFYSEAPFLVKQF